MPISCSVCTKVPKANNISGNQVRYRVYIIRELCKRKGIEIIEAQACPDHIHMLLSIPPKYAVADVMGYLKGKSSLMIFDRHANLKYKFGRRTFWARGYYVDTVGRNKKAIQVRSPSSQHLRRGWRCAAVNSISATALPGRSL